MEMSEAPISTIHGLMKFEKDCGMAKETPVTKIAGHTSFMPRYPANGDEREERQLPTNHRAQKKRIEAGDTRKTCDRCTECAVRNGRGVGDKREAGRRKWGKPQAIRLLR